MADNTYRSNRNRNEVAYDGDPADPLAELARLIGQSDPRNDFGHAGVAEAAPVYGGAAAAEEWSADERYAEPGQLAEPAYDERYDPPRFADPASPYRAAPSSQSGDYGPLVPPPLNGARGDPRFYAPAEPRYPVGSQAPVDYGQPLPAFVTQPHDDYDYEDQEQDDASYAEDEEEARGSRGRGGLIIVAVVLAVAVFGTAGTFAYRAMFGGSMMPSLPPIIKADNGPNKIMPSASNAGSAAAASANTGALGEKVVSREERPVDVPAPVNTTPRVVSTIPIFPAPSAPPSAWGSAPAGSAATLTPAPTPPSMPVAPAQPLSPAASASPPQPPTVASTEPKKIHTVAVRPDQAGPVNAAPPAAAIAPPEAAAPRVVAAQKPVMAPAAPRPAAIAAASGNAPLSIVPNQGDGPSPAPARVRTASAQPVAPGPAANIASAGPGAAGRYAVQITSQRSEAEAQTAFRALATKYPTQLGGHQPIIRQADLGAKGIYYRALVGPFASMEQAAGLCSSLKEAGGSCIVQRN
jgi:hypothetical protein